MRGGGGGAALLQETIFALTPSPNLSPKGGEEYEGVTERASSYYAAMNEFHFWTM